MERRTRAYQAVLIGTPGLLAAVVPEDRQDDVFRILSHGGASTGAGIGLAVCDRIGDRHGGDIRVESSDGEGATFYVSLPREPGTTSARSETRVHDT